MPKLKEPEAKIVIEMPSLRHLANGAFWFFLPVPFFYEKWPFKRGEKLLVTVTRAKQ